jgi:hypothetical protein
VGEVLFNRELSWIEFNISEFLEDAIADNPKIRWLQADGTYQRACRDGDAGRNFQEELMAKYQAPPAS